MNGLLKSLKVIVCCVLVSMALSATAFARGNRTVWLRQSDFENGTYIIKQSGLYRLAEDVSFNPHAPGTLAEDGVTVLDAYSGGMPFPSQYGNPDDGKYDPAAFGIGFFAAIVIQANNVILDLNGHTIEQSAEHALLQRFFSVIELADQPFVPNQGPFDFGTGIISAKNVIIKNGKIGRSSHHGIHGNGNKNISIINVDFEDFEVAAIALNGVDGLSVINSSAINREDVPIIGTFSNARFITPYVNWLADTGSATTLTVLGTTLTAAQIRDALRNSVNNAYQDIITDGLGFIDPTAHPDEYALYHNKHGIIDGNSYGFLVNKFGVAVGGFPTFPDNPSKDIFMKNVHILSQRAFINEVIALNQNGKPVIDPVGAVFMVKNLHPDTGAPVTVSSLDDSTAVYTGNALANAQALVAKAAMNGEFPAFLSITRLNITQAVIDWIENQGTLDTLATGTNAYFCNGDTMFHVNKGVIGFKMDAAKNVLLCNTSAENLENLGEVGSALCGNYEKSHPDATLPGYGGAKVRGYTFAGSRNVLAYNNYTYNLKSLAGTVIGFDILTDSKNVVLQNNDVIGIEAGLSFAANGGPNEEPDAIGFHVGADARNVILKRNSATSLDAYDQTETVRDDSGRAIIR